MLKNDHIIAKLMIKEFISEITNVSERDIIFFALKGPHSKEYTYISKLILDNRIPSLSFYCTISDFLI